VIACGEVGPDVPLENIRAMYEAFYQYGRHDAQDASNPPNPDGVVAPVSP
jgi:hypothetical protein